MKKTTLQRLLDSSLNDAPNKMAIRTENLSVNYRELDRQVRCVAAALNQIDIRCGDRVAWLLPNCLEAVLVTLACYQIGAVVVPLNYRYVPEEARDVLARTGVKLLVYHKEREDVLHSLESSDEELMLFEVGGVETNARCFDTLLDADPIKEPYEVEPQHPALILFTSGSTGRPKGVVHSHAGAFKGIEMSRRIFDFQKTDVVLVGKPISHAGGLQTQLMPALLVGGETILAMKPKPIDAVKLITAHSVSEYGLLASDLLDFIEFLELNPTELPSLKNVIGSGDSVPADLHHRFRDLFGWEVMEGAGMTEVGGYYAANPRYGERRWGSLGLPTPETELRIVGDDDLECPVGQTGEIVLQMPSETIGYWNDLRATQKLFRNGWLHTGDLARRDDDGYIWFVGRKKLMIIRRGSNIAPPEVENIVDDHPLVHASVVVGVADSKDGQIPVACVTLMEPKDASSELKIRSYVAKFLAAYKNPVHYLFLDELPRTPTGKFDRHQLQELASAKFVGGND